MSAVHAPSPSQFVSPTSKAEFDGALGLTTEEIARSLGIQLRHVRQKLTERGFLERIKANGFRAVTFVIPNSTNGIEFTDYVLDVNAAKFFVAKYGNEISDAYLVYLLHCERIVLERMPLMVEEIARLRSQVTALTRPRFRQKGEAMVEVMKRVISEKTMFGEWDSVAVTTKKIHSFLSPEEKDLYTSQTCARSMDGQAKRIHEIAERREQNPKLRDIAQQAADLCRTLNSMVNRPELTRRRDSAVPALFAAGLR